MSDATSGRPRCLTEAEIQAVRSAPLGQAPEALARHLASCERCQERALFLEQPRRARSGRPRPEWPSPTRSLLLLALMVAVIAASFYTLRLMLGR